MDRAELLNDNEAAQRLILDGRQSQIWTALPGIVHSVDLATMTCSVQPVIQGTVEDENGNTQSVNLPLLLDCPIVFPSGGGFIITFPLAVDDEVLVVFSSRCIDAWWQLSGVQRPMEARMHDLSDGFVIPGPKSIPNVPSGLSTTNLQIRNMDGSALVQIGADGKVSISAAAEIDITAPLVNVTGALVVSGALTAGSLAIVGGGSGTVAGSLNVTGEVTANGIPLSTHKHTGVQTGGGTSGPPTP